MKIIKQFKAAAMVVAALGCIHICATPMIFPLFKANNHVDASSVYMFVITGVATLFAGWLQLYTLRKLNDGDGYRTILKASLWFVSMLGIGIIITGAVSAMWKNPFAWIIMVIMIYEWILHQRLKALVLKQP